MASVNLLIVSGSGREKTVQLTEGRQYVIGRSDTADINLDDVKASRRHAVLSCSGGQWAVHDQGSTNGVYVGNERISSQALHPGGMFRIGQTVFSLQPERGASVGVAPGRAASVGQKSSGRPGWFFPVLGGLLVVIVCFIGFAVLRQSVPESPEIQPPPKNGDLDQAGGGITLQPPEEINFYDPNAEPVADEPKSPQSSSVGSEKGKDKTKSREHYRMGLLFYDSGHLKKAIDEWDLALAFDSSNSLVIKKLARALKELDYEVGQHYRTGKMHMKYLRHQEAEREFMIVVELARNKNDERYVDSLKQLEIIQNK